jgi:hypothetical protein
MLSNWVFFVLNACLVVTNTLGLALAMHRRWVRETPQRPATADGAGARTEVSAHGVAR